MPEVMSHVVKSVSERGPEEAEDSVGLEAVELLPLFLGAASLSLGYRGCL